MQRSGYDCTVYFPILYILHYILYINLHVCVATCILYTLQVYLLLLPVYLYTSYSTCTINRTKGTGILITNKPFVVVLNTFEGSTATGATGITYNITYNMQP
jgi:hypothetical protein